MKTPLFKSLYSEPSQQLDSSLFGAYSPLYSTIKDSSSSAKGASLFENHELKPKGHEYILNPKVDNDFYFPFLSLNLLVVILFLSIYRTQFFLTLSAFFSSKQYQQIEQKPFLKHPISISLFMAFIINISLVIILVLHRNNINIGEDNQLILFLYIAGAILLFYFLKVLLITITAFIFKVGKLGKIYINYIFLWAINTGIIIGFFLWPLVYVNQQLSLSILIVIGLLFGVLRVLQSSLRILPQTDFNLLHFFIYLCTVEILPLIVLGKIVMSGF